MPTLLADLAQSQWISTYLAPVFLLGFLIFIHESGHFLFAKLFGVPVEQFSFGFGPRIAGVMYKGTDYRLNLIPLGGYVKMVGDDPFEPEEFMRPDGYLAQPAWQRLFIVAAGPVFNLVLPIFLFASVYVAGAPQPVAWVGNVQTGSLAESAGLEEGDRIVEVNGETIGFWNELVPALEEAAASGSEVTVVAQRGGATRTLVLPPPPGSSAGDVDLSLGLGFDHTASLPAVSVVPGSAAAEAGVLDDDLIKEINGAPIRWWFEAKEAFEPGNAIELTVERPAKSEGEAPKELTVTLQPTPPKLSFADEAVPTAFLGADLKLDGLFEQHPGLRYGFIVRELALSSVLEDKPAALAGMEAGDTLIAIGDTPIGAWSEVKMGVSGSLDESVDFTVLRGASVMQFSVLPEAQSYIGPDGEAVKTARVGIGSAQHYSSLRGPQSLGVGAALKKGVGETWLVIATTVKVLGRIITGDIPAADAIGGPIAIVKYAQASASVSIFNYFKMMALISVSLGLMNLLPIPLLDGGHLLFFGVEAIRGRPVSLKFREISHQVGLIFLLTLIVFAIINDTRLHILN